MVSLPSLQHLAHAPSVGLRPEQALKFEDYFVDHLLAFMVTSETKWLGFGTSPTKTIIVRRRQINLPVSTEEAFQTVVRDLQTAGFVLVGDLHRTQVVLKWNEKRPRASEWRRVAADVFSNLGWDHGQNYVHKMALNHVKYDAHGLNGCEVFVYRGAPSYDKSPLCALGSEAREISPATTIHQNPATPVRRYEPSGQAKTMTSSLAPPPPPLPPPRAPSARTILSPSHPEAHSRSALLDAIQSGTKLKHTPGATTLKKVAPRNDSLAAQIAKRRGFIDPDDDEDVGATLRQIEADGINAWFASAIIEDALVCAHRRGE